MTFTMCYKAPGKEEKTSTKGTIGPGRRPLAYLPYYVITVNPACV